MLQFSKYKVNMWHFVTQMIVLEKICYLQYELNTSKHENRKIYTTEYSCSWHIFPSLRAKICKNKLYTIRWVLHAQYSLRNFNLKGHFSWKMNKTRVHKLPLKCGISPQKHETAISPMFKPSTPWYNTGIYHYTVLHGIVIIPYIGT